MSDQACANNLNLDVIPQDLTELSTMERRLISYRLPFMTLIAMRRYGGHYKVNGPPVNIPAKLCYITYHMSSGSSCSLGRFFSLHNL